MPRRVSVFLSLAALLILSGCGDPAPEPEVPPQTETVSERQSAPRSAAGSASTTEATASGPGTNEAAIEHAREQRNQLRQRSVRDRLHWDEATMTEELGIDADQFQDLLRARQNLLQERVSVRTGLLAQRHSRQQAETAADSVQLEDIEAETRKLRARLETAEQTWQNNLQTLLTPEQIAALSALQSDITQGDGPR